MQHVSEADRAARPNILFVLADDLGWGDVAFHGGAARTPNLDRFKRTGTELAQHYVCPVCTPTRVALLTGRHPSRFGAFATAPSNDPVLPPGYETLAEMLRRAGYATALFGKWHLGSDPAYRPNEWGFEESYGSLAGGVDPYNHGYKRHTPHTDTWHENGARIREAGHATDLITDRAISWIEGRDRTRPWFCYVPFTAVHTPIKAPERWLDAYEDRALDVDAERDGARKRYLAYTSHMDECFGRLLEALKRTRQHHNTLVVFTSDNGATPGPGDMMSYPGWQEDTPLLGSNGALRGVKTEVYEGGIRTPTLLRLPGVIPEGRTSRAVLHVADWMPTLGRIAGAAPASDPAWDGTDVWDVLTGTRAAPPERSLYWNVRDRRRAVRSGRWKLVEHRDEAGEARHELYEVESDPEETVDLAAAEAGRVAELRETLERAAAGDGAAMRPDMRAS